jgi:hypothetical protein
MDEHAVVYVSRDGLDIVGMHSKFLKRRPSTSDLEVSRFCKQVSRMTSVVPTVVTALNCIFFFYVVGVHRKILLRAKLRPC